MYQRCGLEGVTGALSAKIGAREFPELVIKQLGESCGLGARDPRTAPSVRLGRGLAASPGVSYTLKWEEGDPLSPPAGLPPPVTVPRAHAVDDGTFPQPGSGVSAHGA